ncbi:MAG: cell division protein FtsK [Candidatus Liberibacter europaeus]|uniref:DNA translocase FtsK n=1 Tax=Candidatus Liberibacter europaeus TaxID=744859 RepID=A0A2T4VYZ9_9HYPH|nr:cell division protein FtsK [Candidatus Liberibacter europaeus]PTL87009.1 MAG: cell division protein FtsK [Candidatus Liberibacter europaeus]
MSQNIVTIIEDGNKKFLFLAWVRKKLRVLTGLTIIVVLFSAVISLATWDVYDPSFSYITLNSPNNFLGYGGAIFADIVMQCFGLAIVFCLPPPFSWAWSLLFGGNIHLFSRRFSAWIANFLVSTSFFASFPPTSLWPIQNGFGGIIGDVIIRLPILFIEGHPAGIFLFRIVLFVSMIVLLLFASGAIFRCQNGKQDNTNTDDNLANVQKERLEYTKLDIILGIVKAFKIGIARIFNLVSMRNHGYNYDFSNKKIEPTLDISFSDCMDSDQILKPQNNDLLNTDNSHSADHVYESSPETTSLGDFILPSKQILCSPKSFVRNANLSPEIMHQNACALTGVLSDFGVQGEIVNVRPGPVVTLYELEPAPGIKSSRVIGLSDDIARSMSAVSARVAVIPGRNAIGIELPNDIRETVLLGDLILSNAFNDSRYALPINLGKSIEGDPIVADLAKMPHLLIAGTTGSGKSVAINTMILSLLYRMSPDQCRLLMIDPKMLELSVYDGIPNLLTPVVTDSKKAVFALKWLVCEMEERYRKMSKVGVRNIDGFNMKVTQSHSAGNVINRTVQTGFDRKTGEAIYETEHLDLQHMPYIVVVIDEMADLMMVARKDIEGAVQRLAQMARAAGIHVVMATQRPSVDVITGTIKANFPTRISFQVSSKIDSRTILGEQGAEQLLGQGDMLYMTGGGRIQRIHGPFVSDIEVEKVVSHLKKQGKTQYIDLNDKMTTGEVANVLENSPSLAADELYQQAVAIVLRDNKASISYIQRRLGIGYNRAASLIECMEEKGIIGPASSSGKREILVSSMEELA